MMPMATTGTQSANVEMIIESECGRVWDCVHMYMSVYVLYIQTCGLNPSMWVMKCACEEYESGKLYEGEADRT